MADSQAVRVFLPYGQVQNFRPAPGNTVPACMDRQVKSPPTLERTNPLAYIKRRSNLLFMNMMSRRLMNDANMLTVKRPPASKTRDRDRVADLIESIDRRRIKGPEFEKAIEDFNFDELEKLSYALIAYYARKFQ